jgi:hypothetical protein
MTTVQAVNPPTITSQRPLHEKKQPESGILRMELVDNDTAIRILKRDDKTIHCIKV